MIILIPDLPPNSNGLGDYAFLLASKLRESGIGNISFLVAGNSGYLNKELEGFSVHVLKSNAISDFQKALAVIPSNNTIHLHYVGYGYQMRGVPLWLYLGLKKWRSNRADNKLIVTFHELYATSRKPWQSSFWLSGMQKRICKNLYKLADVVFTNREDSARILRTFGFKNIMINPVFSNVGEIFKPMPLKNRIRQMVIFGSSNSRTFIYSHHGDVLDKLCKSMNIPIIIDIGASLQKSPNLKTPVKHLGILKSSEISVILSESYVAFFGGYSSAGYLAKSGIFAAYSAHGMLIISDQEEKASDNLKQGRDFLYFQHSHELLEDAQLIADNIFKWYSRHSLAAQVRQMATHYQ